MRYQIRHYSYIGLSIHSICMTSNRKSGYVQQKSVFIFIRIHSFFAKCICTENIYDISQEDTYIFFIFVPQQVSWKNIYIGEIQRFIDFLCTHHISTYVNTFECLCLKLKHIICITLTSLYKYNNTRRLSLCTSNSIKAQKIKTVFQKMYYVPIDYNV